MARCQNVAVQDSQFARRIILRGAQILVCAVLSTSSLWSQSRQNATESDADAVAIVKKAIEALGGASSWGQIGGGTVQVLEDLPKGPAITVQWADDWHGRRALWRRDAKGPKGKAISVVSNDKGRTRVVDGQMKDLPREEEIAVLAVGYPAVALIKSLHRGDCIVRMQRLRSPLQSPNTSSAGPIVEEDCAAPEFSHPVRFLWQFSATTGLPLRAKLPVRGLLHNSVLYDTVNFTFVQQASLLVPSTVSIRRAGGSLQTLKFSNWSMLPSLPSSTFAKPTSQP